jgi:hypothetical protein
MEFPEMSLNGIYTCDSRAYAQALRYEACVVLTAEMSTGACVAPPAYRASQPAAASYT